MSAMEYQLDLADATSELLTAWSCLDNIRLEAIPTFARSLESSAASLTFPSELKEVETYQNAERALIMTNNYSVEAETLEERAGAALEAFRSFCAILVLQCREQSVPMSHLEPHMELPLYELFVEVANQSLHSNAPDPLRDYKSMQTNLRRVSSQAKLASCFYTQSIQDIAVNLYKNLVPKELQDLSPKNSRNWIGIKSCVEKVKQLEFILGNSRGAHGSWFSSSEAQLLVKKIQLVIQVLVNDLWKHPELIAQANDNTTASDAVLGVLNLNRETSTTNELAWMKTVDDYRVLIQDVNYECFRDVAVTSTSRRPFSVKGDGNCFFRAVVKSFWTNVDGEAESLIAAEIRQALNKPVEKTNSTTHSISGEGSTSTSTTEATDPYQEFMIDNQTDPTTMSSVGVWADHVQVKKMTDFLHRPIWIVRHDDANLKLVYKEKQSEWDLSPGPEYKILPVALQTNAATVGTLSPVVLLFRPEVHYDAFITPHRQPMVTPLSDLEAYVVSTGAVNISKAHCLVYWWFDVESDLSSLLVAHQRAFIHIEANSTNLGIRQELATAGLGLLYKFSVLTHAIHRARSEHPNLHKGILETPGGALPALAFKKLISDTLTFENPLLKWEAVKSSVLELAFDIRSLGSVQDDCNNPLSTIFRKLTTFFESLTYPLLVSQKSKNRSELTESQSGAALLLASLIDQFDTPPMTKKTMRG